MVQVQNSVKVLGTISTITSQRTGLLPSTLVATGIHDSNASLVPYLAAMKGSDFAINSSGTWMVIMKPSKTAVFSESDLGKIILYNISVFGSPLRTVNFPGISLLYNLNLPLRWYGILRNSGHLC